MFISTGPHNRPHIHVQNKNIHFIIYGQTWTLCAIHTISSFITTCLHPVIILWMNLELRTGQILNTHSRSADLLGSDGFQMPLSLFSHEYNASQMSHAE